jgi:hypothetical protein
MDSDGLWPSNAGGCRRRRLCHIYRKKIQNGKGGCQELGSVPWLIEEARTHSPVPGLCLSPKNLEVKSE